MTDRDDEVLDALAAGLTIRACAARFDMGESDVRDILKAETDRASDGAEMRAEWMLAARRLRAMELAFHRKALDDLDCTAAVVAIKASERRATLTGANAPAAQLVQVMQTQASENEPTNTVKMLEAIRRLRGDYEREKSDETDPDQPADDPSQPPAL